MYCLGSRPVGDHSLKKLQWKMLLESCWFENAEKIY